MKNIIALWFAACLIVGCGSEPPRDIFQATCVQGPTGWTASHDYETTDAWVLSRVVVFIRGQGAAVKYPDDFNGNLAVGADGGPIDGWTIRPWFQGSIAFIDCTGYNSMGGIYFYLEP